MSNNQIPNPDQNSNIASPANQPDLDLVRFKSWVSVYRVFMSIADTVLELPEGVDHDYAHILINSCVNALYAQHEGDPAWDIAYTKWIEPSDDDGEV